MEYVLSDTRVSRLMRAEYGEPYVAGKVNNMQGRVDVKFRIFGKKGLYSSSLQIVRLTTSEHGTVYFTSIRTSQHDPWRIRESPISSTRRAETGSPFQGRDRWRRGAPYGGQDREVLMHLLVIHYKVGPDRLRPHSPCCALGCACACARAWA